MQAEGLSACVRRRFKCATMSNHDQPVAANLLARQSAADRRRIRGFIVSAALSGAAISVLGYRAAELTDGQRIFEYAFTVAEGLGPDVNAFSCAACHGRPSPGRSRQVVQSRVFMSNSVTDSAGGRVFRRLRVDALGSLSERQPPADAVVRRPPPLVGLAAIEAIPDHAIAAGADPDDSDRDAVSGRMPTGRFGWKARFRTLHETVAAAFAVELGLTSELFPSDGQQPAEPRCPEITVKQLDSVVAFLRLHRPRPPTSTRAIGSVIFVRIGCEACHRSRIDRFESSYTDLLLHDMGPALADGIEEGNASGREFRTAPLWGLGTIGPPYLHDGRASSLEEAILAHGGEAARTAEGYRALPPKYKAALLRFLQSI